MEASNGNSRDVLEKRGQARFSKPTGKRASPHFPSPHLSNREVLRSRREATARRAAGIGVAHVVLALMGATMGLPFLWMVLTSLKTVPEVGLENWLPAAPQWRNYAEVFKVISFARFYWNSIFVSSWITFLQVLTSALAAFSFARLRWPGRDRVFFLYLSTMMVPPMVMMLPAYQIAITLRLVDTFPGLIIFGAFSPFGTFLLRQFMLTLPTELDEAAEIDGASKWRVFWDVILPLARPGLITLAIFTFVGSYQSMTWPLVMLRSMHKYTLPIGLMFFDSTRGQATHLLMAAVTMSVLPMIVLFVLLQRYLVRGIQLGAIKG
ncbi:MAG: carbohydrate ABC transporter permease [Candidatus Sumerlaeota bacterium]|nr:carbohydrate ABC transporter permease [Candidatus Sumerlaeota bacterium]